jgi:hypothetical protein
MRRREHRRNGQPRRDVIGTSVPRHIETPGSERGSDRGRIKRRLRHGCDATRVAIQEKHIDVRGAWRERLRGPVGCQVTPNVVEGVPDSARLDAIDEARHQKNRSQDGQESRDHGAARPRDVALGNADGNDDRRHDPQQGERAKVVDDQPRQSRPRCNAREIPIANDQRRDSRGREADQDHDDERTDQERGRKGSRGPPVDDCRHWHGDWMQSNRQRPPGCPGGHGLIATGSKNPRGPCV